MGTVPIPQGAQIDEPQPGAVPIPQGAQVGEDEPAQPEDKGFLSTVSSDVLGAGKGLLDFAKEYVQHPTPYDPENPAAKVLASQWDSSVQAKNRMMESANKGDALGVVQHAAGVIPIASQVDDAMTRYQNQPTHENLAHIVTSALPAFVPEMIRGAGMLSDTVGDVASEVSKGKNVAQPAAQEALSTAAGGGASSLRESLTGPISASEAKAKALYKQIDDTAGTDIKALNQKLRNTNQQIRQLTDTEEDQALEAKLEKSRTGLQDKIEDAKNQARDAGVDPKTLDRADAQWKQTEALKDVEAKVFKNVKVVKGNAAQGSSETVDIDRAVDELQKLQDSEKYGAPRLEQAFGKDGAEELLSKFYDAQRQGVHAMKMRQVAKWVAKIAGTAAAYEGVRTVLGKSSE